MYLNLSSNSGWEKAETVSSNGGELAAVWDCVWFGNYPQSDATGAVKEPIKWRVLSVNGDDAFLLADQNLDCQRYNDTYTGVTWETCTMRSWLNSSFLNKAFTASEQVAIRNTTVVNEDNPYNNTEGGNNTTDKVYLLSLSEVMNPSYGFTSDDYNEYAESRRAKNTAYAKEQGARTSTSTEYAGNGDWWLRSTGYSSFDASGVGCLGHVNRLGYGVDHSSVAARPALHLNLSDTSLWSYAGTISSDGEENEVIAPNPAPSATPPALTTQDVKPQTAPPTVQSPVSAVAPSVSSAQNEQPQPTVSSTVKVGQVTVLKLKAKKKAIQASWKKVSGANGYEVQVSTSKKFAKKSVKTTKKTQLTISKLKAKKKYFVRVRAYRVTDGKKIYGKWSKTLNVKTKK
ncbi:MAG: DUF6273 domain-containing protein [Roseburia sp.]|nr:DUF6273 domain-containing protein [Roseburia sp.]